ncbi:STAS domain-containing protein [Streptomyces sp. NPDC006464]|uniref:STAS domain-containing protein n=1 Tax=unclassified Streptomyces TaxID=2593676 RepID=UPI0033AAC754
MPDRTPPSNVPRPQLFLVDGAPAWQPSRGRALVRYAPTGCPATAVLCMSGEFDFGTVGCLHEALDSVRSSRTERMVLDLAGVEFADAALVHELTTAHHLPGRLILIGPLPRPVRHVLDLTGTRNLFHIELDQTLAA